MGRAPCCDKANVKKGPWSPEEDTKLKEYIEKHGTEGNWIALPQKVGLKRCGKSCRLRWLNYLRPNLKHGGFSEEEDNIICNLYISIGSRWSIIAAQLPGRTDNDIKNYWNTKLKKKLLGKHKEGQSHRLAIAKQESKHMQSYTVSKAITSANIYGPQQDQHMNIDIDAPSSNFGPGIIPRLFEQNCGSTITESSSSSEPAKFQLNPEQLQTGQEVSDHDSCLSKLLQRLVGNPVDHHSNNSMAMMSSSSLIRSSNCINASQIQYFNSHYQYNLEAASQISYETSATPLLMYARHMEQHLKLENPSAPLVQSDNSLDFFAGNYDSAWMNNHWSDSGIFSKELNDLLLYNNEALVQQRGACNHACG
eukprot:PITA_01229